MKNVIACIDGSKATDTVCDYASWVAGKLNTSLTLLHVLDGTAQPVEKDLSGKLGVDAREQLLSELAAQDTQRNKQALEQGRLILDAVKQRAIANGVTDPVLRQRHGQVVDSLVELEDDIGVLVFGRQGEAHSDDSDVGSHVERMVRSVHRPMLIVHGEYTAPQTLMLAFDNSDIARQGVELLATNPLFQGLDIHLVSVGKDKKSLRKSLDWAEQTLVNAGGTVQCAVLEESDIQAALDNYQQEHNIDMIVMGAYGHTRLLEFFVGSTTNKMIRNASVPLFILR